MNAVRPVRAAVVALLLSTVAALWAATPASARADDTYAAIAYSESTGRYGYSYGYSTRGAAEDRALTECGTDDAQVLVWGRNAYLALSLSDNGAYGYAWAATEATARRLALQKCKDFGGQNARIAVAVYSGD